jgi:hypothetical protein
LERGDLPSVYPDFGQPRDLSITLRASMRIPILVGEICYNLRSALDYLIYELTKLDTGIPQHLTQFPIEDSEKGFAKRRKLSHSIGWLQGLNERHIACIERLQPYNGVKWIKALREISNPDKHREFTHNKGFIDIYIAVAGEDADFETLAGPIQRAPHPVTGEEVDMKTRIAGSILFLDSAPVVETLEELIFKVGETLEAFKPEFE